MAWSIYSLQNRVASVVLIMWNVVTVFRVNAPRKRPDSPMLDALNHSQNRNRRLMQCCTIGIVNHLAWMGSYVYGIIKFRTLASQPRKMIDVNMP